MPAKSKAQARFMYAVAEGTVKAPGLSPEKAEEFTSGMTKGRFAKLKEKISKKK